jgi:hypothetical protein
VLPAEYGLDLGEAKFPVVADWLARMNEREGIKYGMSTCQQLK